MAYITGCNATFAAYGVANIRSAMHLPSYIGPFGDEKLLLLIAIL